MAKSRIPCLALATLMVAMTLMFSNLHLASAQCGTNIPNLKSQCEKFVVKFGPMIPPSPECCEVVKGIDINCACKYFNDEIGIFVSMEKVVYVGRTCGLTIPAGMKCGSYTVPPSPSPLSPSLSPSPPKA